LAREHPLSSSSSSTNIPVILASIAIVLGGDQEAGRRKSTRFEGSILRAGFSQIMRNIAKQITGKISLFS
jgi:hypothetical protein